MFNNNEIEVRFNELLYGNDLKAICDVYPIVPAKKIEKSWWKTMKTHYDMVLSRTRKDFKTTTQTIKYCPGIVDFTNYGYIVPAWQDFQFWVNDNGNIEWHVPANMSNTNNILVHRREQVDTCSILDNSANCILKLVSPWLINTPKGTSLIFCKPFYHYSNEFDVCPGVLDSDINRNPNKAINPMIRFNVRNKVIHIKAGQPLIQLIPFKRTNWKLKYLKFDKNFKDMKIDDSIYHTTRFNPRMDKDSMTRFRHDDSNKKFE